jgi:hypothetical protein
VQFFFSFRVSSFQTRHGTPYLKSGSNSLQKATSALKEVVVNNFFVTSWPEVEAANKRRAGRKAENVAVVAVYYSGGGGGGGGRVRAPAPTYSSGCAVRRFRSTDISITNT